MRLRRGFRLLARPVLVLFLFTLGIQSAPAGMIATEQIPLSDAAASQRADVMAFIDRADVRAQMRALGVDVEEAARRVASLSDAEIERVAGQIDSLPAGEGIIEVLIGAMLVVFLVLLFTDIIGATDVFNFDD